MLLAQLIAYAKDARDARRRNAAHE